jgi:hypothetical protein
MESEVERLVQVRTRELEAANAALRKSEQMLATEIDAAKRLQHVATQLMVAQGTEALHEQINKSWIQRWRFCTLTSRVSRWSTRSGEPPGSSWATRDSVDKRPNAGLAGRREQRSFLGRRGAVDASDGLIPPLGSKAAKTVESYMPGWASKEYQALDEALAGR